MIEPATSLSRLDERDATHTMCFRVRECFKVFVMSYFYCYWENEVQAKPIYATIFVSSSSSSSYSLVEFLRYCLHDLHMTF